MSRRSRRCASVAGVAAEMASTPQCAGRSTGTTRVRLWVVVAATVVVAVVTARLGLWQLDRAAQKQALQSAIDRQAGLPALHWTELASDAQRLETQRHRLVRLEGHWVPEATLFLDNRPMAGRPGFIVLTPLALADGTAVPVQRGWLPRDPVDRTRVQAPPLTASVPVRLDGRMAGPPSRLYAFEEEEQGPIRQNVDIENLAAQWRLKLRATSVQQISVASDDGQPDGLLREWPRPATGVAKHHGYAFQWFALSALSVGLFLWFQIIRPRRRPPPPP